mmetsp:Transcript_34728/g.48349  ORF Transcript_34728/g.48349 Transcript_34728/m.48349 type:complete len:80 (-) Transcript_34728:102-341(-)
MSWPSKRAKTPIPENIRKDYGHEPDKGFEGYADATHMTVFEDCQPAIQIATNPGFSKKSKSFIYPGGDAMMHRSRMLML